MIGKLENRVDDLETERDQLSNQLKRHESTPNKQRSTLETLENTTNKLETTTNNIKALTEATRNRTGANKDRIEELQARELEKGAHLRKSNVDAHELPLRQDLLERFTKTDGTYYRVPTPEALPRVTTRGPPLRAIRYQNALTDSGKQST